MDYSIHRERLSPAAYIDFLRRCDLGSQYPQERFQQRIETLVQKVSISLVARDRAGKVIGICFGITDFAYWCFLSDLGVARDCCGQGIGTALVKRLLQEAGGEENIILYTCANRKALPFYEKLGMKKPDDVLVYDHAEWTHFTVV